MSRTGRRPNRIDACFEALRGEGGTAFIPFLTAADPDISTAADLVRACARAGASIVELGFPYSDPIADGPTIQDSYSRTLGRRIRLDDVFEIARTVRSDTEVPLVGMVSYSLIYRRGPARFVEEAAGSGLDGLIVPDLPVEEAGPLVEMCAQAGLAAIQLVAPTTPPERRRLIAQRGTGFIYCVSVVGTTGARAELPAELVAYLDGLRQLTEKPLAVGFGVSRPQQAASLAAHADGVIVGSAIVRLVEEHLGDPLGAVTAVEQFVREMVGALATAPKSGR